MPLLPELFGDIAGFQWDEGNSQKNWHRHSVTQAEAEQVFFNRPLLVLDDPTHSTLEKRNWALGRSDGGRELMIVFTLRGSLLRVISARPMSQRERKAYAEAKSG